MAKNAEYQSFKKQAKKDRNDMDKKLSVASMSDEEVRSVVKGTGVFFGSDFKLKTLDDGTKCFTDGLSVGILTNEGIFSTFPNSGSMVREHKFVNGKLENVGRIDDENISQYSDKLVKLRDGASALNISGRQLSELTDLVDKASLPARLEVAEKSPFVQQAKDVAVQSLGFDKNTFNVQILSGEDIGLVAKDGFAVGSGDTFYFIPDAKSLSSQCALKEVKLSQNGENPVIRDIPLNEDTAKFVDKTYAKLGSAIYEASDDYKKQINDVQESAKNMWHEKERAEKEAKDYAENSKALNEQYATEVDNDGKNKVFRVGHWGNNVAGAYATYATVADKNASLEDRQKAIKNIERRHEFVQEQTKPNDSQTLKIELKNMRKELVDDLGDNLAVYSAKTGIITMKELSEEDRAKLKEDMKKYAELVNDQQILYQLNDPVAQLTTLYHENNHKNDYDNSGGMSLYKTPKNIAKSNRLTETKSTAVEYLSAAHQYTEMKKQGISTIEVNGEQKPVEYMLEMYPGLKEVVTEKGFDVNDKQSVRNVVEAASKSWHNNKSTVKFYNEQATGSLNIGLDCLNSQPISEQLKLLKNEDKNYQAVSDNMLKNTYIGQNTVVDLRHCRDLLDTMTDADVQKIGNGAYVVSYEELKSVNDYLEQKGIKKDSDKMKYISEHLQQVAYRNGQDKDPQLTNLLLSYNNSILCADGLEYSKGDNGAIICHKDGKDYAMTPALEQKTPEKEFTVSAFQQQNTR